jgi:hypothetical protein
LRSGRFGVGALAAFLLGDRIKVSTRHVEAEANGGIEFETSIDSSVIGLLRCNRAIGTTITIEISDPDVISDLVRDRYEWEERRHRGPKSWDWYNLSEPTVSRIICRKDKTPEVLPQKYSLPLQGSEPPPQWHSIAHKDYDGIFWTYLESPRLSCNGIRVIGADTVEDADWGRLDKIDDLWTVEGVTLKCPNVTVYDPNGHLPLLLQRTGLATPKYPFQADLLKDVIEDYLAFAIVNSPERSLTELTPHDKYPGWYPGFKGDRTKWLMLFSGPDGYSIVDTWNLKNANPARIILDPLLRDLPAALEEAKLSYPQYVAPFTEIQSPQELRSWIRFALGGHTAYDAREMGPTAYLPHRGARLLIRPKTLADAQQPGLIARYYWDRIREELRTKDWVLLARGNCQGASLDFQRLMTLPDAKLEGIAEWYIESDAPLLEGHFPASPNTVQSPLAKAWEEILGARAIPYNFGERRSKLPHAFEVLKDKILVYEALRSQNAEK